MWLPRRTALLPARTSVLCAPTRRFEAAHAFPTRASDVAATPSPPGQKPPLLHFNVDRLSPVLQREFDVEANQRALRHLLRRGPTHMKDNSSAHASTDSTVPTLAITPSTVHRVMWRCSTCGTQWSARPSDRADPQLSDAHRCPCCYNDATAPPQRATSPSPSPSSPSNTPSSRHQLPPSTPSPTANLLCDVHPALAAQWDTLRNELPQNHVLQGVTEVHTSSAAKVWWRCSLCCTPWLESVSSRVTRYELAMQVSKAGATALLCPACERRGASPAGHGSEHSSGGGAAAIPKPRRWLSDDRLLLAEALLRPAQDPSEIALTSETMLQWRCRSCKFEYPATVANRFLRHERCPQCSGKERSMLNLLVIQRPDVVEEISKHISRTKLRYMTVHDDVELPFVCRTCFSAYRMTARARCAVPRDVPACSKCFLTGTQVLAEAQQQAQRSGTQHLSARARRRVKQKALQLSRSNRNAARLAATANELRNRDGCLKD